MNQLSGLDSMFIHGERESTPMHIASLLVYQPSSGNSAQSNFERVRKSIARRLHSSPLFRRRLVATPWQLDFPWWVDDENFDLDNHVKLLTLPPVSETRDLNATLASLHERGLDMRRPLWEAWVIEGLDQLPQYPRGAYGLYFKVHHAAIDGASAAEVIARMHDLSADAPEPKMPEWRPVETSPPLWQMALRAYTRNIRRGWQTMGLIGDLAPTVNRLRQQRRNRPGPDTQQKTWLRTPMGRQVGAGRVIETVRVPLTDLRKVRRLLPQTTINHVVLAAVGGALRRYLHTRGELPDDSLSAAIPMNVRRRSDDPTGNQVNIALSKLCTDIDDPLQRLEAVRDAATRAREGANDIGPDIMQRLGQLMSPWITRFGMNVLHGVAGFSSGLPWPVQTVVSNIPGPPVRLYMNGDRLVDLQVFGLLVDAVGLFHALISYNGSVNVSVLASPTTLADPGFYRHCLLASFEELVALTGTQSQSAENIVRFPDYGRTEVPPELRRTRARGRLSA